MYLQGALLNSKATSQIRKDVNFRRTARAMKLTKKSRKGQKTNHNSCTRITDVYTVLVITNPMIAPRDNNTRPTPLAILPVAQVFITKQNTSQFSNTSHASHQSQSTVGITTPTLPVTNPLFQHNFKHPLPINQQVNYQVQPPHFQHLKQLQVSPLQTPPQSFNPQIPPPYFPQYPPSNSPSVGSNDSSILAALQKQWEKQERLDKECFNMERQKEERKRMKEEWEQKKEEQKRLEKQENQQCTCINKAFEKIPRFDGTNPSHCFDWLEQTEALVNEHQGRVYREELLLNCGTSVAKTIHALPQEATNQQIKDAVLQNHSNLRTVLQCSNAY